MVDTINSHSFVASVNVANQFGAAANLPELIMAVQMQRADVIENQVKDQVTDMQKRNEWLQTANSALSALRTARPTSTDATVDYKTVTFTDDSGNQTNALQWCADNGIPVPVDTGAVAEAENAKAAVDDQLASTTNIGVDAYATFKDNSGNTEYTNQWALKNGIQGFDSNTDNFGYRAERAALDAKIEDHIDSISEMKQSEFDSTINNLKSSIDTVNSTSQMDMVRLQGLMDKRGQAYDLLTNSLSKFDKSMDSPIGNIR